ncbi:MAG: PhzF family phenazine biosynthesis protein, partial [Deltaproteobacteria bacterium]|nr:PhzF family phenazine biosynthesis protein [Deltaproteobacteria bacterium]
VDAFTDRLFGGNPAAVCPLARWLDDATLQAIALENNLSETAFLVRQGDDYELRWFTPTIEVPLCGHATLASGFVVLNILERQRRKIVFHSKSGPLTVERDGDRLAMDFPALPPTPCDPPPGLTDALGTPPQKTLQASLGYLAVLDGADRVRTLQPDMWAMAKIGRSVIVSAAATEVDFVSRFFAPAAGIPEDPVTGSAHCVLTPYWAERLGKTVLKARQVSRRGGDVWCELRGNRVRLLGQAVLYLNGTFQI